MRDKAACLGNTDAVLVELAAHVRKVAENEGAATVEPCAVRQLLVPAGRDGTPTNAPHAMMSFAFSRAKRMPSSTVSDCADKSDSGNSLTVRWPRDVSQNAPSRALSRRQSAG
jgi:hypothetical protein